MKKNTKIYLGAALVASAGYLYWKKMKSDKAPAAAPAAAPATASFVGDKNDIPANADGGFANAAGSAYKMNPSGGVGMGFYNDSKKTAGKGYKFNPSLPYNQKAKLVGFSNSLYTQDSGWVRADGDELMMKVDDVSAKFFAPHDSKWWK